MKAPRWAEMTLRGGDTPTSVVIDVRVRWWTFSWLRFLNHTAKENYEVERVRRWLAVLRVWLGGPR